ncbi:MAG: 23S rRNA pseudouridine(1911/1915/1917) synthase RluD [Oleiphilaceae bacterium]|nr:23S rRNA pseudouridine(1911/1915/1917) synthase RluD [Oleiphilaceae bacterium]
MTQLIEADFVVAREHSDLRFDQVLAELMPDYSRSRLQQWIKQGQARLNGQVVKPKEKVKVNDLIELAAEPEAQGEWLPQAIQLDIVHEDAHILVLNKPAGLVVHPAAGNPDGTLVNALLHHDPTLATVPRAGIVHRLDKDTTGLMVVAKTLKAHAHLVEQLQLRTMGREYEAVVTGVMTGGGTVDEPIARHSQQRKKMAVTPFGKPAVSHYRLLQRFRAHSHVRVKLETGRTHQIRVHMAHLHHPLVGDPIYGGRLKLPKGGSDALVEMLRGFKRQALHAKLLRLVHPETEELCEWESELPDDMQALLAVLQEDAASSEAS